jgi:hypothetical protein
MREVDTDASGFIEYREFVKQFHQVLERNGRGQGANDDLKRENARLYERLKDLERRLHSKDSEDAIRAKEAAHVKNMQIVFAQQCAQYEATIANLQHQLAMASKGGAHGADGNSGKKAQLGSRVAELQAQVNDLRTFYSKKVRSLEDSSREAQARATAAEKKLRESREKWASTKARQTARLTYLERQVQHKEGQPGEMDRLRAELQEARAHADWYQQQMAFFEQSRNDVQRAMVGQRKQQSRPATTAVGATPSSTVPPPVAQYPSSTAAGDAQLASLRHEAEMERMRAQHTLDMERLRNEMRGLRSQPYPTQAVNAFSGSYPSQAWAATPPSSGVAALEQRLRAMESNYVQRELELKSLAATAARMPMELGATQHMAGQQGQTAALALSSKSAEVATMHRELNDVIRELETMRQQR